MTAPTLTADDLVPCRVCRETPELEERWSKYGTRGMVAHHCQGQLFATVESAVASWNADNADDGGDR